MNVLHVIVGLNNGGAENFLYRLARSQITSGKVVTIVSLTNLGSMGQKFLDLGIVVHCLNLKSIIKLPGLLIELRRIVNKVAPDVVQSWMYHADFLSCLAMVGLKKKHIWSVRCTDTPKGSRLTFFLMKLCSRISYFGPDKVCYVANAAMLSHHKHGFCKTKSIVISNGYEFSGFQVDHQARDDIRQTLAISSDTVTFGVLGRLHPDKGQDLLLQAFSTLNKNKLKLLLIGAGCSEDNATLVKDIERLGIGDDVKLLGNQSNVVAYLSALDFYVMPSRTEGFPNALAEAMAMSLPCVATRVGDTELLCNNNAILCDANVESIADSIVKMISLSGVERSELGNAAAAYVRERFSIANIEKQYSKLYFDIVGS